MKRTCIFTFILAFLAAHLAWGSGKKEIPVQDKTKAQYIFLEAQKYKYADENDAYFDLLKYAYSLDTTNTSIAFHLGASMLSMENLTRTRSEQAIALMKKHFNESPDDYYETTYYCDACMMTGHREEALRAIELLSRRNPNKIELQVRLAHAQAQNGDFTGSNATYDSIVALHGPSLQVTTRKVSNYLALNDSASALSEMRALLATAPQNVMYCLTMSTLMQQLEMPDSALHYLDCAQQAEPDNGYTYLAKARFYHQRGDSAAYDSQVRLALMNENLDVDSKMDVLLDYTRTLMSTGDSTARIDTLMNVLVAQHPHEPEIHNLYSDYLVARKDFKAAAEQLGYVLDIEPTDAQAWRRLMLINMMDDNTPAALAAAEKALEYNPDSMDLYRYIAPAYFQMKQYDKALDTYRIAIEKTDSLDVETLSDLYCGMGDAYFEKGDTATAFASYEKSLQLNPFNSGTMNNYAYFLSLTDKELDKAERMAATAVKMNPENGPFIDTYAWVFYKKKDYPMALLYIKSAIEHSDEPSADLYDHYGDILEATGEHEQAVEQWKKALALDSDNDEIKRKINSTK